LDGIIVGAGIGGLCVAASLRRRGINTRIVEAAHELQPVGAGIVLAPNALSALERMGLLSCVVKNGHWLDAMYIADTAGKPIQALRGDALHGMFGHGVLAMHRADLHAALLEQLPRDAVLLNKRATGFDEEEDGVRTSFFDNTVEHAAFLIGADGLNSVIRSHLFPSSRLRYSGQYCWRGVASYALPDRFLKESWEIWGSGRRFGFVPLAGGRVYWYAVALGGENGVDPPTGAKPVLAEMFNTYWNPIPDLIESTADDAIVRHDLHDLRPMARWSKGRAVLMGDAAHGATPNLGQGGCQAIEDAHALAEVLSAGNALDTAFGEYEARRKPKADWIVEQSWKLGRLAHWRNGFGCALRNMALRRLTLEYSERQLERICRLDD
jgi:2-polyprenyl-6-methoxyphenol hydroxylase-like FAD-dependent oxidoreductase